jgi:lysozyme family protein
MGQGTACKFLQRALNLFNLGGTTYPDSVVDGSIGTKTLTALDLYLAQRKSEGELVLLRVLNSFQGEKCAQLAEARVKDETFVYGWFLNRVVI